MVTTNCESPVPQPPTGVDTLSQGGIPDKNAVLLPNNCGGQAEQVVALTRSHYRNTAFETVSLERYHCGGHEPLHDSELLIRVTPSL